MHRSDKAPRLDPDLRCLMKERDQLKRTAVKSGNSDDWQEYRSLRNKMTKLNTWQTIDLPEGSYSWTATPIAANIAEDQLEHVWTLGSHRKLSSLVEEKSWFRVTSNMVDSVWLHCFHFSKDKKKQIYFGFKIFSTSPLGFVHMILHTYTNIIKGCFF